jgi:hypothetical protein
MNIYLLRFAFAKSDNIIESIVSVLECRWFRTLAMTMNNYRKNILIDVRTKGNVPVIRPHGVHLDKMSTSDKTPKLINVCYYKITHRPGKLAKS